LNNLTEMNVEQERKQQKPNNLREEHMKLNRWMAALVATVVGGLFAASAMAQPQNFQQGGQQIDPQQAQQAYRQFMDRDTQQIREQLGVTDEEWAVIQPRIQKVRDAEQAAGQGQLNQLGRLARGRPGQGGINVNALLGIKDSTVQQRQAELQKAIDDPNSTEAQIKQRLDAVREAKVRAMQVLAQARKELIEILTQRQEAILFQMGLLE